MIEAQAELEGGVAGLDVVLDVGRLLLDRRRLRVGERRAAARQIVRQPESGIEVAGCPDGSLNVRDR